LIVFHPHLRLSFLPPRGGASAGALLEGKKKGKKKEERGKGRFSQDDSPSSILNQSQPARLLGGDESSNKGRWERGKGRRGGKGASNAA